ncbi:hypothetical protein [Streptomyces sp. NPDC005141]
MSHATLVQRPGKSGDGQGVLGSGDRLVQAEGSAIGEVFDQAGDVGGVGLAAHRTEGEQEACAVAGPQKDDRAVRSAAQDAVRCQFGRFAEYSATADDARSSSSMPST